MSNVTEYWGDPTQHINRQGVPQMERKSAIHFRELATAKRYEARKLRAEGKGSAPEFEDAVSCMRRYTEKAEAIERRHREAGYAWAR